MIGGSLKHGSRATDLSKVSTILDSGSSTAAVEEKPDMPPLGLSPVLVAVCIPTFLLVIAISIANSEWGLVIVGTLFLLLPLGALFQRKVARWEAEIVSGAQRNKGPVDRVRSGLDFSPTDGQDLTIRRLGGGGTHIVTTYGDQQGTYVIVIAKNGLGVSKTFKSYAFGKEWAQDFVRNPYEMDLAKEITYDEIAWVQIDGRDVIISSGGWLRDIRLREWFHHRSHKSQVNRLIDRLGFIEDPTSPGTYERAQDEGKPRDLA